MRHGLGRARGFTLVETLVVTAIIGVLAALLFPTFAKAKAHAKRASCISQLRQIGMAMLMYASDHGELAPRLSAVYPTYCPNAEVFVCPADPASGHHEAGEYMEGASYLPSGVSYTYIPNWKYARQLGWWGRPPRYGPGKWGDSTPLAMCHWHWAKRWLPDLDAPTWGRDLKGWIVVLEVGGSVSRIRAEQPPSEFDPTTR
jgi:prepilin-type N-terminal cleavage/methylation domain-containing protein